MISSSRAPTRQEYYPCYFKKDDVLLAFKAPDRMYKIEARGTNKNEGVAIDYYTTRKMVLYHWPGDCKDMTWNEFDMLLTKLFAAYIRKIVE